MNNKWIKNVFFYFKETRSITRLGTILDEQQGKI